MNGDPQTISGGNVEDEEGNLLPPEQQGEPLRGMPAPNLSNLTPQAINEMIQGPSEGDHEAELAALAPQPSIPVRLEWYGRNLGEHGRAANYGPNGNELQDDHVAISPNNARELGLQLGDWV